MRVINTSVNTLSTRYLVIGFEGENERTQIRIDAASVFDEYPQASPSMAVKPGFGEEVYPVIVTKEDNEVVWDVTQDNLDFTGDGEIQLTFIKDNVICKTTIGKIRVNRSLIVNGDPPEHLDTWYEEATAKLADVDAAVYSLEALDATASGLPAGSSPTVEVQDVNDHKRLVFGIPKGDRGDRGPTGNGIRSISQSGSTGLYKKYTIHYTDGTTTTFQVRDGDRGLKGDTGATPDIGIGTVETLPAGSEATASMSGTAENPRLNLGIPKGDQGIQGEKGDKGDRGATPVFSMGAVTNLPAGSSATATITGTAEEPVLNLGIPKGDKGDKGDRGERGPQGIQGIQGDRGLTGPRGEQGQKGDKGDTGATGATGATPDLSIGTVSTLPAGSSATAEITGTAENPVLSLGIPQGVQGEQGEKGDKGDPGEGVPTGGITGQVLAKASDTDRDTEWIHVAPVIKNTASGAIASFPDGADGHPVDELKVQIEPVQDLHGYDHPWPGGGNLNLLDFSKVTVSGTHYGMTFSKGTAEGTIVISGTLSASSGAVAPIQYADTSLSGKGYVFLTEHISGDSVIELNRTYGFRTESERAIAVYLTGEAGQSYTETIRVSVYATRQTAWTPYSNICPITGHTGLTVTRTGKNLLNPAKYEWQTRTFNGITYTVLSDGSVRAVGTSTAAGGPGLTSRFQLPAGTYYGNSSTGSGLSVLYRYAMQETGGAIYPMNNLFVSDGTQWFYINLYCNAANLTVDTVLYPQIELGTSFTGFEPYAGNTYDIAFPTEAGTVYGGTLDVSTGLLTVDRTMVVIDGVNKTVRGNGATSTTSNAWFSGAVGKAYGLSNFISDRFVIGIGTVPGAMIGRNNSIGIEFLLPVDVPNNIDALNQWFADNPTQLCYGLAEPITYTLTASEIRTLLGQNNVWSDAGDVAVKYNADTKLYIDGKIAELVAQIVNS